MSTDFAASIAAVTSIPAKHVQATIDLLDSGATIPFIARYRKEATGTLDETGIFAVKEHLEKLTELENRRNFILQTLTKNEVLTAELKTSLKNAATITELEDIYLPYKPKRKTRGQKGRDLGLEQLAANIKKGGPRVSLDPFLTAPNGEQLSPEEAIKGAQDIIAEDVSEDRKTREELRNLFLNRAVITSTVNDNKKDEAAKYRSYFNWQEPAARVPGHRLLAMLRGEREKFLKLSLSPPQEDGIRLVKKLHLKPGPWQQQLSEALEDCYQRLLCPSIENELKSSLKEKADSEAIAVFQENLKQLLLAAPLGQKSVLAIDPGYRTGCKVVCLNEQGDLLENTTIFPVKGAVQSEKAAQTIRELVTRYNPYAIAIGNGTAGRETESFIRALELESKPLITLVNEDGASIYSASQVAREEFPDHDITVRGAVSIGRRLQDPLAELVKIDPKSIGVGQYQHDVNQTRLKDSLDTTIAGCVNRVGVELNTASVSLLTHVAGLGKTLAENIVAYRTENGPFKERKELLKVTRLGPKAFEQCAGFLRVSNGKNPLDGSGVHPERYSLVKRMAEDNATTIEELLRSEKARKKIQLKKYLDHNTGFETLNDIMMELAKPGRDPRRSFEHFQFDETIHSIDDLTEGMILPAIITNITRFGAFADLGVKQDGLIHISQLANHFVKDPADVVKLGQKIKARVMEIDRDRGRIALSLK